MFCTKCGAKLPEGAKFCTHCGAPVAEPPKPGANAAPAPKPRPAAAPSAPRTVGASYGAGPASAKAKKGSKMPALVVAALVVCAVAVGGLLLVKGSGKKPVSTEGTSTRTWLEDTGSSVGSSAGADQAEPEASADTANVLVDVDADSVTVKIPAITEADFGNGFYDTYSMYYGGTPAVIEDASRYDGKGDMSIHFPYTSETGEQTESYITVEWKAGGILSASYCEINADLYEYFTHDLGMSAEEAKQYNQDLASQLPIQCRWVYDDDEALRTTATHKLIFVIQKIREVTNTDGVQLLIDALYRVMEMENDEMMAAMYPDMGNMDATVTPMQSGTLGLNGYVWPFSTEDTYYPEMDGEKIITNQPAWTADMDVEPEDMVGKLQVQKDENGNITLVHLYNDTACYDHKFIYDDNGLLWTYEYYEYPKGQKPEDVGPTETAQYVYDVDGRIYEATSCHNETGSTGGIQLIYDEAGRITQVYSYTNYDGSWGSWLQTGHYDTLTETYEYDEAGKVCRVFVQEEMTQGQDTYVFSPIRQRIYTPVQ